MGLTTKISTSKKVLFSCLVFFLLIALLEGYGRVKTYLDTGNKKYLYTTPYQALRFGLGPLPYRGREISENKSSGIFRIAALGGSTTFGWGIESDSETWPAQLETILRRKVGKSRIEVINFGQPHATSEIVLDRRFPAAKRFRPDFYIIFSGYNDYDKGLRAAPMEKKRTDKVSTPKRTGPEPNPQPRTLPRPENENRPAKLEPSLFERGDLIEHVTLFILNYSVFAHRLRELFAKVWYKDIEYFYKRERERLVRQSKANKMKEPEKIKAAVRASSPRFKVSIDLPAVVGRYQANINSLLENIKTEGPGAMLMTLPVQWNHPGARHILESGSLAALNRAIREIAAARKIPVCDIEGPFKRHSDPGQFFIWDYIHPDPNGAKLIAETLADCLDRAKVLSP
jgi:lysophospholipase L1-like esterase